MATNSKIEWTEATWNPVVGCARVSAGCDHCYAVTMTHRLEAMGQPKYAGLTVLNGRGERHFNGVVRCDEAALGKTLRHKKPKVYFVNSMSDLFHRDVSVDFIALVFMEMHFGRRHTYQILTKRPDRMADVMPAVRERMLELLTQAMGGNSGIVEWPLPNVWLGTSVENQAAADERIPHLLKCPAAVRFLSCEPILGPVDLVSWLPYEANRGWNGVMRPKLNWVIVGGESGKGARPCNIDWIRSIVSQCKAAGVPCFVKQLGRSFLLRNDRISDWPRDGDGLIDVDWYPDQEVYQGDLAQFRLNDPKGGDPSEWPEDLRVREFPVTTPAP